MMGFVFLEPNARLVKEVFASILDSLPRAAEPALRKAMPVLEKAVKDSARGRVLSERSGDLANAVQTIYLQAVGLRGVRAKLVVPGEIGAYGRALERGERIDARGAWMIVPLSTSPLYSLSGPLQRAGLSLSQFYQGAFTWESAAGNLLISRREGGEFINLAVKKQSVQEPKTEWFSKGIEDGMPEFMDVLTAALLEEARK